MAAIETSRGKVGFVEQGSGDRTPIIFLHGVGSDKSVWRPQLEHFARTRRALAFDYPGYGESTFVEGATRDDFAASILAAMDAWPAGGPSNVAGWWTVPSLVYAGGPPA